jgi:methylmalonyl-CoA mutase N-terminal domain/subunit
VAFTLAHACAYVDACVASGLDVNAVGARLSFFFNAHSNFVEEIAKFRAARRLWARLMRDRFGATDPRAQQLRFHAQTAGSTLTAQQPDNNIVRVTLQALSAVLGGAQSIHTNGRDEALALPTEESATIALRTQQILLHESGVARTADPAGGSYAVEELTTRIETEARRIMDGLEAQGGVLAAIERGAVQREIQESAYRTQRAVDAGEQVVVGVNRFADNAAGGVDVFRMDPGIERAQVDRVRALRSSRSEDTLRPALAAVDAAARSGENLVPPIIAAVERLATLGEIADTLRGVFGEHQEAHV